MSIELAEQKHDIHLSRPREAAQKFSPPPATPLLMASPNPSDSQDETTMRAVIHGRVQGVGYRYFVLHRAGKLGLRGAVRNRADGTVEVEAMGSKAAIEKLLGELKEGPTLARVTEVAMQWGVPIAPRESFDVSY